MTDFRKAVVKGAHVAGIAALVTDGLYTLVMWLILGRNERRTGRYAELKYFAIIGQLSVEVAAIVHLREVLRKLNQVVEAVDEQK